MPHNESERRVELNNLGVDIAKGPYAAEILLSFKPYVSMGDANPKMESFSIFATSSQSFIPSSKVELWQVSYTYNE